MENMEGIQLGVLTVERTFDAPIEEVFAAFTQPDLMSQWFYAFPKGKSRVEVDLRVGGKYSIDMMPDPSLGLGDEAGCGGGFLHHGEYLEISPPNRLSFTWIKDGFVDYSVVVADFKQTVSGTLVTLTHHVPTDKIAPHTQGWNLCLDSLETFFNK